VAGASGGGAAAEREAELAMARGPEKRLARETLLRWPLPRPRARRSRCSA
jgi:hypothetical protein